MGISNERQVRASQRTEERKPEAWRSGQMVSYRSMCFQGSELVSPNEGSPIT